MPGGPVRLVDQTLLPRQLTYRVPDYRRPRRGYPYPASARRAAIGIAAAYGLCLAADLSTAPASPALVRDLEEASVLRATWPTAVNLAWALDRVLATARAASPAGLRPCARRSTPRPAPSMSRTPAQTPSWASTARPARRHERARNAGPLAAGGIGSALGIIYSPLAGQGSPRLGGRDPPPPAGRTPHRVGWGVPCTLIADSMAASSWAGRVDAVITGADRIASNGDAANKIGTYGLAVLARAHNIPFYIVAPVSTFDLSLPDGRPSPSKSARPPRLPTTAACSSRPMGGRGITPRSTSPRPALLVL